MSKQHHYIVSYDTGRNEWELDADSESVKYPDGTIYDDATDTWHRDYSGDGVYFPESERLGQVIGAAISTLNRSAMTYQELRDYALQCSLEHHLCNVEQLLNDGETLDTIMNLVENGQEALDIAEPYDLYVEASSLVESIEDRRGVNLHEFMHVLRQVNGEQWAATFKGATV